MPLFLATRLFHGVGIAAFTTAYTTMVAGLALSGRRGEAVGLSGTTSNLGLLFAPALGAYVLARWGAAAHFLASAAIAAGSVALVLAVAGEDDGDRRPHSAAAADEGDREGRPYGASGGGFWSVARRRPVWVAALGSTGLAVAYGAVLSFMPPFAAERNLTAAGGLFSAFAVAMMAAQAAAGWLSDRIGRRLVAAPGMVLAALSMAGLAGAGSNGALLLAGAGLGLSWGLVRAGLDTAVVDATHPEARGTALSVLYTCFDTGVGAGSFGLGLVAQARGYSAVFWAAAVWAIISLAGYLVLGRRRE
jgi:MFS family permease